MRRFLGHVQTCRVGGQPAPEHYEPYRVLWRGYIANRDELLAEANGRGAVLATTSDGELFAHAYRWWGIELQSRVLGEYAVAISDERSGSLLMTHDALGLVPLFYAVLPSRLIFGSHLEDVVLATGEVELDEEYIADYLANACCVGQRTPYRRIRRLPAGRTLLWRDGRLTERRTWDLADIEPVVLADDREYEDRLRELARAGVNAALPVAGAVWSECSGGLDSSSVACLAAQAGAKDLAAISIVFGRCQKADESPWAQLVVDQYSLPWHQVDGDSCLPYSQVPDRFVAEPGSSLINWGWRRRYEEVLGAHGVEVLLTGQAGDQVFFGSGAEPFYLADLARAGRPDRLWTNLRQWRQADPQARSLLYWLTNYVIRPTVRHALGRPLRRAGHPGRSPWICEEYARAMRLDARARRRTTPRCRGVAEQWFRENLASLCGSIAGLNQIPTNFEYRHPLLYRPLVEFMYAIPWEQKLRPGTDRYLQRQALRGILPEKIRLRQDKTSLDQPTSEGLRQGRDWLDLLTNAPRIVQRGIVDGQSWREAVAAAKMGRTHFLPQFEAASTLEIWLRQLEQLPSRTETPDLVGGSPAR